VVPEGLRPVLPRDVDALRNASLDDTSLLNQHLLDVNCPAEVIDCSRLNETANVHVDGLGGDQLRVPLRCIPVSISYFA